FRHVSVETTTGKKQKVKSTKNKDFITTATALDKEITYLENNGFPFAQLIITEQFEADDHLTLKYKIDSGTYFIIDKIHLKSNDKFHDKTVLNLIGIQEGDKYN